MQFSEASTWKTWLNLFIYHALTLTIVSSVFILIQFTLIWVKRTHTHTHTQAPIVESRGFHRWHHQLSKVNLKVYPNSHEIIGDRKHFRLRISIFNVWWLMFTIKFASHFERLLKYIFMLVVVVSEFVSVSPKLPPIQKYSFPFVNYSTNINRFSIIQSINIKTNVIVVKI